MRDRAAAAAILPALGLLLASLLAAACGPPSLRPTALPDPQAGCPGARTSWSLEILDQRANREGSEKLQAALRDAITKSFPDCSWRAGGGKDQDTITIEVHRFSAPFQEGMWSAAAEWSVWVHDAAGRTLTEFEARSEVDRPNYQGSNNEKEALQQVFQGALERTAAGLRSVSGAAPPSSSGDSPGNRPGSQPAETEGARPAGLPERNSQYIVTEVL